MGYLTGTFKAASAVALVLALLVNFVPPKYGLRPQYHRPPHLTEAEALTGGGSYDDFLPDIAVTIGKNNYPLIFTPATPKAKNMNNEQLQAFVTKNRDWMLEKLIDHGAILYRGFETALSTAREFEDVAIIVEPDLANEYLGTSPRSLVEGCRYVHTASEIPGDKTIPNHCEMSFLPNPPERIMFFADSPNEGKGGETPLVDYQRVLEDLDPEVLARFKEKRIRYVRAYYDAGEGQTAILQTKSWQAMFSTEDPRVVEQKVRDEALGTWKWGEGKEGETGGVLKLVHTLNATRIHPVTGAEVWHNHMNVIHNAATASEMAFSAQHLSSWYYVAMHYLVDGAMNKLGEDAGMHTTHADGEEMLQADTEHIRQMVWKHTVVYQHKKGDWAILDNRRIGHGRQPFTGPRRILVAWK